MEKEHELESARVFQGQGFWVCTCGERGSVWGTRDKSMAAAEMLLKEAKANFKMHVSSRYGKS